MFKAAFYETEITPPLGTPVPGHTGSVCSKDVAERLYAKAVVINNGEETVATVVIDALHIPQNFHKNVTERVGEYTGIKPQNITVCCNHTHEGGPVNSHSLRITGDLSYIDIISRLAADCITLASRRLEPVNVKYGCGRVYGISFNRDFVTRDGRITSFIGRAYEEAKTLNISPEIPVVQIQDAQNDPDAKIINPNCAGNLAGIDPELPVLVFENKDGKPIGAMINFACHQTAGTSFDAACTSGDYSSVLSKKLKEYYGNDFVSLFVLGTCGDINHVNPCKKTTPADYYQIMGCTLADEAIKVISSAEPVCGNALASKKELLEIEKRQVTDEEIEKQYLRYKNHPDKISHTLRNVLVYKANSGEKTEKVFVQCTRIGDVYFYALPGEMYMNFGLNIKQNSPSKKNLISELANGLYNGYIPTKEALHPNSNIYAAALCINSCLVPQAGYIITEKALELASALKNK